MTKSTAAVYYQREAYDTSGQKLMGRQAAGEGFLKGYAKYAAADTLYCFGLDGKTFDDFNARVARFSGGKKHTKLVPFTQPAGLAEPGCLFVPGPGLGQYAWLRRRVGQKLYSLCGVTHTTASDRAMEALGQFLTAPVQPWDALICTSTSVRKTVDTLLGSYGEYLKQRLGCKKPKVLPMLPVIPLGVDCAMFPPREKMDKVRAAWRKTLHIKDGEIAVMFMGRLSFHAKAHPHPMFVALEDAARVTGKKIHLLLCGWFAGSAMEKAYRQYAKEMCPSVNVLYLDGRAAQLREQIWYAADIFTSLSDNIQETFGLTPIEAMAAGLPQVITDWDGYKDTVRNGQEGIRVPTLSPPPGGGVDIAYRYEAEVDSYDAYCGHACLSTSVDIGETAKAFISLIQNPELRKKMGEAGRKRALSHYDWEVVVHAYEELWAEQAKRRASETENAPPVEGEPENPLRDDPFRLFASYATEHLAADAKIHLLDPLALRRWRDYKASGVHSFGFLATPESCDAMLGALASKDCTVEEILGMLPSAHRVVATRTLIWFAKTGLIAIGNHNKEVLTRTESFEFTNE